MEGVGVTHIPLSEDAGLEVESSNKPRRSGPGSRAKNYKKFKRKNETSKSAGDLSLFADGGTEEAVRAKMTTIKSSSELADFTNSIQSKTQIQATTTTTVASNNEWTETPGFSSRLSSPHSSPVSLSSGIGVSERESESSADSCQLSCDCGEAGEAEGEREGEPSSSSSSSGPNSKLILTQHQRSR